MAQLEEPCAASDMKKLWYLLLFPLLLIVWWLVDRREATPNVRFEKVKRETIQSIVSTNGKLEPLAYATARAEVAGVVTEISIERGDRLKTGQTLVTLDNTSQRAAVDTAQAQLAEAKADASNVQRGGKLSIVTDLDGRLQIAQLGLTDAQRRLDSTQRLYDKHAATKEELLIAQAAQKEAKQKAEALSNNRRDIVAPSDRNVSSAKVSDAAANLLLARHRLDQTIIKSPMAGIAYRFDIKKGDYLEVGSVVASVGVLDQMKVRVYVDEPDLGRVALNMPVRITWEARPGQHWNGRVTQVPSEIVPLQSRQVGIVQCIIENAQHELLPGTNIDANIISKIVENAVSIPKQALQRQPDGTGVWKLSRDSRIHWQPVSSGISSITSVEVMSGLQPGDRIVLPSDDPLKDGMKVHPELQQ